MKISSPANDENLIPPHPTLVILFLSQTGKGGTEGFEAYFLHNQ
jgi:hypothetical protein